MRRFRPPQRVTSYRVLHKAGPWQMSGHWWDHQRWSRVEWDIETEDEQIYRIVEQNGWTFVEGIYD